MWSIQVKLKDLVVLITSNLALSLPSDGKPVAFVYREACDIPLNPSDWLLDPCHMTG